MPEQTHSASRQQSSGNIHSKVNTNIWLRACSFALIFVLWQFAALFVDNRVLPTPYAVLQRLMIDISSGELLEHLWITLVRVAFSFFFAMLLGTAIGLIMGSKKRLDILLDGLLMLGLNVPALVTIILCYIWFGLTEVAAVVAVAINKIPMVIVNMREGARAIDAQLMEVAKVYRISKMKTFHSVYLPQLSPYLIASMRNGLALIWKIVLVVELLGRSEGVGFQLSVFFQFFDIEGIFSYTLAFVLVIYLIEWLLLRPLERSLSGWRVIK
ncbi:MAG: ABC transporter permease [Acidiferrobacterales bacterium]|nr:ABC transporter permease [Acidiferrobacterales bacterium]